MHMILRSRRKPQTTVDLNDKSQITNLREIPNFNYQISTIPIAIGINDQEASKLNDWYLVIN
jgi:hypothetical protein